MHLAAQAGVRYSLQNPYAYCDANLVGFLNVLEGCRHRKTEHLVYASSSSVYGANKQLPFSVHHNVDHPISLYAASKKANEAMAHAYSHLYGIPATGLRFFTVYGPWGRPDMAMYIFAKAISEGHPIKLFNYGRMRRDFTYVDDVVEAVERLIGKPPAKVDAAPESKPDPAKSSGRALAHLQYRKQHVGRSLPCRRAPREGTWPRERRLSLLPMQPGDVAETCADVNDLMRDFGFRPSTRIEDGISRFVAWFRDYHAN